MSNIDKIRQEIKRRHDYENEMYHKKKLDGRPNDGWAESLAIMGVLEELLSFIDSLPDEASYDTQNYAPNPSVSIDDVARVQFASHAKVIEKKRKAILDWEQFKKVAGIFYGFGKRDSLPEETCKNSLQVPETCKENARPLTSLEEAANEYGRENVHYWYDEEIGDVAIDDDFEDLKVGFIAGAEWMKKEINKELIKAMEKVHEIRDVDYDIHVDTSADGSFETISYYENGKLVGQERSKKEE